MSTEAEHKTLQQLTRQYLATRAAIKNATEALEILQKSLESLMTTMNIETYECDGKTITLVKAERRTFNAQALKALVNQSVFKSLTEVEVRAKLVDAALDTGKVSEEVINQITTTTPYTQLRIN